MTYRNIRLTGSCLLTALAAVALCASPAVARMEKIGKGEGVVDIVAWPGYIERGDTDKNFDLVTDF